MSQMRILVLDDSKSRHEQFRKNLPYTWDLWFTYEAEECIDLLDTQKWDVLFLDHDLGNRVFCPSDENSGYAVACWLEEFPSRKPKVIVIHSANPVGARKMWMALKDALRMPFIWARPERLKWVLKLAEIAP